MQPARACALNLNPMERELAEGSIAADELRLLIERIERLEEEKKAIADDVKDVYAEAKARGYDAKTMRTIVRLRKMESHVRQEAEALLDTYKAALGLPDAARRYLTASTRQGADRAPMRTNSRSRSRLSAHAEIRARRSRYSTGCCREPDGDAGIACSTAEIVDRSTAQFVVGAWHA